MVLAAALEVERPVFFSVLMIIGAYLPLLSLTSIEGLLFRPMALTLVFALVAALVLRAVRGAGAGHLPLPPRLPGVGEPAPALVPARLCGDPPQAAAAAGGWWRRRWRAWRRSCS